MKPTLSRLLSLTILLAVTGSAALGATPSPAPSAAAAGPAPIRFVVPAAPTASPGERDLTQLVEDYNQHRRAPGDAPVQLIRRGDNFSSLKEFVALYLAGDPPELAAIEASEHPALVRTHLPKPLPAAIAHQLALPGVHEGALGLPFARSVPVLVADQELLYRLHADRAGLPRTWDALTGLAARLATHNPGSPPLVLPLQGPRGLWIFEALAAHPLWTREAGGLRTNRDLDPIIQQIQSALAPRTPELAASEMNWDRGLQDFLDRRSPLLITTLDALPTIARKASFRWKSAPLPTLGRATGTAGPAPTPRVSGSDLVVTADRPDVWKFVVYLYSKEGAARWMPSGGFLPLREDWTTTAAWKASPADYRALCLGIPAAARTAQVRSTDTDVVRAHTEWISALHYLFGEPIKRLPTETVFTQLDSALAP